MAFRRELVLTSAPLRGEKGSRLRPNKKGRHDFFLLVFCAKIPPISRRDLAQKTRFELVLPFAGTTPLAGEPLEPLGYFCKLNQNEIVTVQKAGSLQGEPVLPFTGTTLLNGEPLEPLGYFCKLNKNEIVTARKFHTLWGDQNLDPTDPKPRLNSIKITQNRRNVKVYSLKIRKIFEKFSACPLRKVRSYVKMLL